MREGEKEEQPEQTDTQTEGERERELQRNLIKSRSFTPFPPLLECPIAIELASSIL